MFYEFILFLAFFIIGALLVWMASEIAAAVERIADAHEDVAESLREIVAVMRKPDPEAIDKTAFEDYFARSVTIEDAPAAVDHGFGGDDRG